MPAEASKVNSGARGGLIATAALAVVGVSIAFSQGWVDSLRANLRGLPTAGYESAPAPLGAPPDLLSRNDSFTFIASNGATPVSYDPCRPIHYTVNPVGEPRDGMALIERAIGNLEAASGFRFVYDGTSTEPIADPRQPYQRARYGDRWAPVLIAWSSPSGDPQLAGEVVGDGGSVPISIAGHPAVFVSGRVSLDAPQLVAQQLNFGPGYVGAVVQHELAHVLGLGHTDDPSQLMYPEAHLKVTAFGDGDLTGLAELGRAPCAPWL